jgi:hypothetical protein
MSESAFDWLLCGLTFGLAFPWIFFDSFNLWKLRKADSKDPIIRDRRFGYFIGICVGLAGTIGVLDHRFWHRLG